jgi:hypothetical protein
VKVKEGAGGVSFFGNLLCLLIGERFFKHVSLLYIRSLRFLETPRAFLKGFMGCLLLKIKVKLFLLLCCRLAMELLLSFYLQGSF